MNVTQEMVNRCLTLIPLIREHDGITLEELGRLSRIPPEQIAGDLGQVMMMCGVPPYFPHDFVSFAIEEDRVFIRFADHFRRPVSLTALEALALKLACVGVSGPDERASANVRRLMDKVEAAMSPEQQKQFRNLTKRVAIAEDDDAGARTAAIRGPVALAVAERRVVVIDYGAAGRAASKIREVEPYGILAREGFWYLVGHDRSRGRVVPFRLDRVRSLDTTEERFEIPGDFRLDTYANGPLVPEEDGRPRARVRVHGVSARWLRETVSPETVQEDAGGAILWEPTIGTEEGLARFLLEFGSDAEVLSPPSLRSRVAGALRATLEAHG